MKNAFFIIAFLFIAPLTFAQSVQELVDKGITYHDAGQYDKAIATYKLALKQDPKSSLVNYEISLSYFKNKEYKKSIKHADVVIKQKDQNLVPAYISKGNCLDMLGKTSSSIKLFEKAIANEEPHYLLYYNLAVNYVKVRDYDKADKNALSAIGLKSNHSSSHLLLATTNSFRDNDVQAILSLNYFLFLEPTSSRAGIAYDLLMEKMGGNTEEDSDGAITINLDGNADPQMMAAQLIISMFAATNTLEMNEGKTKDELHFENTKSFFKMMGEMKEEAKSNFFWDFYVPFFADLAETKHMETFCKYTTQVKNENSVKWLEENADKIDAFSDWLGNQ